MKQEQCFCDRCGRPICTPDERVQFEMPWKIKVKYVVTTIWFQKKSKQETCDFMHDLCDNCMVEFAEWWKGGKNKG